MRFKLLLFLCIALPVLAQSNRFALRGHMHPKARAEFDRGRVAPSLRLTYMTLALGPSPAQKADLEQLLEEQQTPGSPNYHRWITPEEYAQRFGASDAAIGAVTAWLGTQGLTVTTVARGHGWIAFDGTAAQVEAAFQTELHHYLVDGEMHFANATEPSVPTALAGAVTSIRGLHDFRLRPHLRARAVQPDYTSPRGNHYLAPGDLATIYNIAPLYNAGITGAGQSLVIAGQSQIVLSNIQQFRSTYNLPAADPQATLVPGSRDPGLSSGDEDESHLDLEWSGAVARNAKILYVYAFDVLQAVQYAIDQNLAPVVSESYGACELETLSSDATALRAVAQQGNAQGITWFGPSGDSGAADCNDPDNPGLSVDIPASIPEVTGVGGTEFQEGTAQYWTTANDLNSASVLSYIPEITWNDSVQDGQPAAAGGGASIFFPKPSWQTGPGVPGDNARHVPDIALNASADHDGYLVYSAGLQVFGGTSVPTPVFAGVAALINQYLLSTGAQSAPGLGNMNPRFYSLAQASPDVFHDITTGTNIVTVSCPPRSRGCTSSPVGYAAGPGYDLATGLGSMDIYKLATKWGSGSVVAPPPPVPAGISVTLLSNLITLTSTDVAYLIVTVKDSSGATPTGSVQFSAGGSALGSAPLAGSTGTATAVFSVRGAQLPVGAASISAAYAVAGSGSALASIFVTVTSAPRNSGAAPTIAGLTNSASFKQVFAPGELVSVFGSQLANATQTAAGLPLPLTMTGVAATVNGIAAPLYYVSPGQVNLQIPYEAATGGTGVLSVNSNGQVSVQSLNIAAAGPGIFADAKGNLVPFASAKAGQVISLYLTGAGAVSPAVASGATPSSQTALANLPRPLASTTVTVGGVNAPIQFIGIAPGLVGVVQINFQVPAGIALGAQPVVVTVGGASSAPATLTVTN